MKISLINPCLSTSERYGKKLGKVGPTTEPLGLAYLAAVLLRNGHAVEIIDAAALNYNQEDLMSHLTRSNPDVVGVMVLTPMYLRAQETIKITKKVLRDCVIIVGGPHVTIFPYQTLEENPEIDYAVIGEGEITLIELLNMIEHDFGRSKIRKVKGIAYREGGKIRITGGRGFVKDIDSIPLPARQLLPMKKYIPAPTYYRTLPSYVMLTSRGCPYRCVYCSKIFGKVYRFHSVNRIVEEMKVLIGDYGAKEIIFRDDTFTINRDHVNELCYQIIEEGLHKKIKWTCMTRVNLVDRELLMLMKKAGCWSIHYGIESGSLRLLSLIQKDITIKQIKDAIKWTKNADIETKAFFMLGLPTETKEESMITAKFTRELNPDWIQVTLTVPYPGTKLYELAKEDGTLKSFKWENYQTWAGWSDKELVYVPSGRSAEELKILQRKIMKDFYLRPKFILRQLKNLGSFNSVKTYVQGAYALLTS